MRNLADALDEPARSVTLMLVLTGLRVGELLALRWGSVDLNARVLRVRETVYDGHFDQPKTRRSARTILIGPIPIFGPLIGGGLAGVLVRFLGFFS